MNRYGGNLSHRKHRTGPWGTVTRKHRAEVNRLLSTDPKRPSQSFYSSVRDLFQKRSGS